MQNNNSHTLSTWTTGAGIVIGTNCDISGVLMGSVATTVILANDSGVLFTHSGPSIHFTVPVGVNGPITATSSGGNFAVVFINR